MLWGISINSSAYYGSKTILKRKNAKQAKLKEFDPANSQSWNVETSAVCYDIVQDTSKCFIKCNTNNTRKILSNLWPLYFEGIE